MSDKVGSCTKFVIATLLSCTFGMSTSTLAQSQLFTTSESRSAVTMDQLYREVETKNLRLVKEGFDAWKNGSGSPYQLLDDNVSWTIVGKSLASKEYKSRKAFIDEVITPFNARMSKPLSPTVRNMYADGDTVIVLFDAEGTAKDGKIYANTYSWFLELKNGRIARAIAFFDSIHFNDLWTRVPVASN